MRYRNNPWPAFVDLFAALLIFALGGFILLVGEYDSEVTQKEKLVQESRRRFYEAEETIQKIESVLKGKKDTFEIKSIRRVGEDIFFDLEILFEKDKAKVEPSYELRLKDISGALKSLIDDLPVERRRDIEIVVEGHTDDILPKNLPIEATRTYNWKLSSERAISVLDEFSKNGIDSKNYQIYATGYADTRPVCKPESSEECRKQNKRTTLCLRPNTRSK